MKTKIAALLMAACCLVGCQAEKTEKNNEQVPNETVLQTNEEKTVMDGYVEAFDPYDHDDPTDETWEDRRLTLEQAPLTEAQALVLRHYRCLLAGEFEELEKVCGENTALASTIEAEKENFAAGRYVQTYTIHQLQTVSKKDLDALDGSLLDTIVQDAEEFSLDRWTLVQADFSMSWSEQALSQGPQIPDGRYSRYFLAGQTGNDEDWKLYELYWLDQ